MRLNLSIDSDKTGAEFAQLVADAVCPVLNALLRDPSPHSGTVNDPDGHVIGGVSVEFTESEEGICPRVGGGPDGNGDIASAEEQAELRNHAIEATRDGGK